MLLDINVVEQCDLFIKWDGLFCPCCGSRLRIGPRNIKNKAKLRKQKAIEEPKNKKNIMLSISLKEEICYYSYSKLV
jgi:hypothetical protein